MINWLLPLIGAGLYQTPWGKDMIQNLMGVPKANSAYNNALGMNQQQYNDYIELLKEQATETQPYQQGLLWQLMTGGNQDEMGKFQWGDAWNTPDVQPEQPAITDQTDQTDQTGQSYSEWRDNIYSEVAKPFEKIGEELGDVNETIIDGWNQVMGHDLGKEDLPKWLGGDVKGGLLEPWETGVGYVNKILGVDLGKEDLPKWLGGDVKGELLEPWETGVGYVNKIFGVDLGKEDLPWNRWRPGARVIDTNEAGLTSEDYKITESGREYIDRITENGKYKITRAKIEDGKATFFLNTGYTDTVAASNIIDYTDTGKEKINTFKKDLYEQNVANMSPYEKFIYDRFVNNEKITDIKFADKDKANVIFSTDSGQEYTISSQVAFPDHFTELENFDSLELKDDGTIAGITSGQQENVKVADTDTGTVLEKPVSGETTRGITIGDKSYSTPTNAVITETKYDEESKKIIFIGEDGSKIEVPIKDIAFENDIPLDDIQDISLDDGNLKIKTSTYEITEPATEGEVETVTDAETEIAADIEAGMTPEEALNKFMMGSQLGSLFGKQWQQESQGMMGNAARLEKESLNQILGLGANRNPYGWSGATEGMARDLERGAIIPAKLDAFNYPTQQSDQMIMGTLGNLMQPNNINYPMPASVQPNYYGAMAGNQLGTLGLLGLYSNPFSLLTNYMSNRNTNKSSGPNTMSGFGQSLGLSTLFGQ